MRILNTLLFTLGGIVISVAQTTTVKGRVVDENNKPVPYASVFIENSGVVAQTNDNGEYLLKDVVPENIL